MDSLQNATWFASFAILAACWRQLLTLAQRLRSFFIVSTMVQGDVARAITQYCWLNYRRSPFGDRYFRSGGAHIRSMNRMQEIAWEKAPSQPLIFFLGWRPFLLGGTTHTTGIMPEDGMITITGLRWWLDVESLIILSLDAFNASRSNARLGCRRYAIYRVQGRGSSRHRDYENSAPAPRPGGQAPHNPTPEDLQHERVLKWAPNDIGPAVAESPMAAISLPPEVKPAMEEFQKWLDSEKWFAKRRVPWRRGWLLHGRPGTGKTSFVRALAQQADIPIFSFDLASLSNDEMVEKWLNMLESVPCIALMEDIDAVFEGRTNLLGDQGGGLTFDCLLNCISGIQTADGVFLAVTTNNLENVDPALGIPDNGKSTRPGRIDRLIEMPALPKECRQEIAERILDEWPEIISSLLDASEGYTGAQFTELCVAEALSRFWQPTKS